MRQIECGIFCCVHIAEGTQPWTESDLPSCGGIPARGDLQVFRNQEKTHKTYSGQYHESWKLQWQLGRGHHSSDLGNWDCTVRLLFIGNSAVQSGWGWFWKVLFFFFWKILNLLECLWPRRESFLTLYVSRRVYIHYSFIFFLNKYFGVERASGDKDLMCTFRVLRMTPSIYWTMWVITMCWHSAKCFTHFLKCIPLIARGGPTLVLFWKLRKPEATVIGMMNRKAKIQPCQKGA